MTQTHETIPVTGSSFMTQLTTFLEREDADRFRDMFTDFVVSGGVIATIASLTQTPTALTAYCGGFYSTESGSITFANNSTTFVIADANTAGNLTGYTRVSGTHYLTSTAGVQPPLPSGTINIATVVTVGGSITAVTDTRNLNVISEIAGGLGVNISTMAAGALLIGTGSGVAIGTPTSSDSSVVFTPGAGTLGLVAYGKGTWKVHNNRSAVASNTTFSAEADEITLRSASFVPVTMAATTPIVNTVTTAGPTANGRDQAGAFSASSWVHFYWIWNGATLATVSSATGPTTGPTLPSGYTHWAFIGTIRFNGASQLIASVCRGAWVYYQAKQLALANGSAGVETAVDISALVPPLATSVRYVVNADIRNNLGGNVDRTDSVTVNLRFVSGSNAWHAHLKTDQITQYNCIAADVTLPPGAGMNIWYIWGTHTFSTVNLDLDVMGYEVGA